MRARTTQKLCSPRSSWRLRPEGSICSGPPPWGAWEPLSPAALLCLLGASHGGGPPFHPVVVMVMALVVDDGGQGVSQCPEIVNYYNIIVSQCVVSLLKSHVCFATESCDRSIGKGAGRCISRGSTLLPSHLRPWLLCSRHPKLSSVGPCDATPCRRSPPALCVLPAGPQPGGPLHRGPQPCLALAAMFQCPDCVSTQGPSEAVGRVPGWHPCSLGQHIPRLWTHRGPGGRRGLGQSRGPAWMWEARQVPRERKTPESHSSFVSSPPSCVLPRSASGFSETKGMCVKIRPLPGRRFSPPAGLGSALPQMM